MTYGAAVFVYVTDVPDSVVFPKELPVHDIRTDVTCYAIIDYGSIHLCTSQVTFLYKLCIPLAYASSVIKSIL